MVHGGDELVDCEENYGDLLVLVYIVLILVIFENPKENPKMDVLEIV